MNVGLALEISNCDPKTNTLQQTGRSRLVIEVDRALRSTGYMPLRDLHICQQGSTIILHGRVPTYHLKQLAQATAMGVLHVQQVRNDIEVTVDRRGVMEFATADRLERRARARPC